MAEQLPSIADIAVAIPLSNLRWARVEPGKGRWPKTCAWVERTQATPALAKVTRFADKLMQAAPDQHRQVLAELGVHLNETTISTDNPRHGSMMI